MTVSSTADATQSHMSNLILKQKPQYYCIDSYIRMNILSRLLVNQLAGLELKTGLMFERYSRPFVNLVYK